MYRYSNYSGKIQNILTNEVFEQDDRLQSYNDYYAWVLLGNTTEVVEYLDGEENEMQSKSFILVINNLVDELTTRALASAIGKQGTRTYLESQKGIYLEKNNVATGVTVNTSMEQTIIDEMNRDYPIEADLDTLLIAYGITPTGTKYEKFCSFIAFRYAYGTQLYGFFISLVEDFRTCALTHVERNDFNKAGAVIEIAKSIPIQVTQQDLLDLRVQMFAV